MRLSIGSSLLLGVGAAVLLFGTADTADAHVCMESPLSRVGPECTARSPQKIGPCGVESRGQYVSEFRPGQTITLALNETVNHPSHYRVSFNPDGDTFHDPVAVDDMSGAHPFVLLDGIEDEEDARQSVQITFPDVECDNCTLQLIQVMYDKGGNGFGGGGIAVGGNDDIYYSCADIVLKRDSSADAMNSFDDETLASAADAASEDPSERRGGRLPLGGLALTLAMGLVVGVRARRSARS